ncbi:ATP-binding protein [Streptomyces sp. NPDC001537]
MTAVDLHRRLAVQCRDAVTTSFPVVPCNGGRALRDEDAQRVRAVRRLTASRLERWGLGAMTDDVLVIVSELLTNALMHSGSWEITFMLTVHADELLRIAVRDGMPGTAEPKAPAPAAESGRGLWLLDALVAERGGTWGTHDVGACTWCELPLTSGARQ